MAYSIDRREFLKLAGLGGAVLVSGRAGFARGAAIDAGDFYFVQLSDLHWGFEGPAQNPDNTGTLKKAIAAVNGLAEAPDFVVFTGDLTHTTDDPKLRRKIDKLFTDTRQVLEKHLAEQPVIDLSEELQRATGGAPAAAAAAASTGG